MKSLKIAAVITACFSLVSASYAEGFKLDPYTIGGAAIGWAVAGPFGAGALGYAGNKIGEHEQQQDAAISVNRSDINTLGNYVASEPWKEKLKKLEAEAKPSEQTVKNDWRSIIPQGNGGL